MSTKKSVIIKSYSDALFQASKNLGILDLIRHQTIQIDMVLSQEVLKTLNNPLISIVDRSALLNFLLVEINAHDLLQRFFEAIITRSRIGLIPNILNEFLKESAFAMGIIEATLVTAQPLKETPVVVEKLSQKLGKKVNLKLEVDESLIAGCVLYARNIILDASLRTRLIKIKETLSHGV